MAVFQLNDNRWIGCTAFEVMSFPMLDGTDAPQEGRSSQYAVAFLQLVKEFYRLTGGLDTTMAEILWATEPAENQPFQSRIRLFLVLRHIGNSSTKTEATITSHSAVFSNFLATRKYELRLVNDLNELIALLPSAENLFAVVKKEKCTANSLSPFPYYYSDVVPSENRDNFESLISMMSQQTGCCIAFQLFPTNFTQQELYLIREMTANLSRLVSGVIVEHQMLQDVAAREPAKVYSYYNERIQAPLFKYNLLVFGTHDTCAALSSKIISLLQSGQNKLVQSDFNCIDLSNERLNLRSTFLFYPWNINNQLIYQYRNLKLQQAYPLVKSMMRLPHILSSEEAASFFRLPLYARGMAALRSNMAAGPAEQFDEAVIREDNIKFGSVISGDSREITIGCPANTFTKHALIVGVPGSGKTTFAFHMLLQFYRKGVPFLAIEPTKTEYRGMIDAIPELQVFTPGNGEVSPFILNPFIPPRGIRIEQYIPSLASAFKAAFSMPSPLDVIFLRAIRECYTKYGWKDYSQLGDADVTNFGLYEFILVFKKIIAESNYSREVKGNIESGGVFRLLNLIEQNSSIYDNIHSVPIEDLLSKPTVLELNAIENTEQKALIMALLLINICTYTKNNQNGDGQLKNAILIDEAHVLLGGSHANIQGDSGVPDSQGTTVKALQDMIAEIRSYGTSIIIADQSPAKVSREIVAQTEIKIAFRLVQSLDKELIADTTNMDAALIQQLSRLKTGETFAYYSKLDSAQLIVTPDIREREHIRLTVSNEEVRDRMTYWNPRKKMLRPYRECMLCSACADNCSFRVRSDAEVYARQLSSSCGPRIKDDADFIRYAVGVNKLLPRLIKSNYGNDYSRLLGCVIIRFCRNIQLTTKFKISGENLKRILLKSNLNQGSDSNGYST